MRWLGAIALLSLASSGFATEYHVALTGNDGNDGSTAKPLRTIQHAADLSHPGDIVTVHAGIYRERVNPPRGGMSDQNRITYQAAHGESVTITGAEPIKGWVKIQHDTWKVVIPNTFFGDFNPFASKVQGEWCGRHSGPAAGSWYAATGLHAGSVYLNGEWLAESPALKHLLTPSGKSSLWFAQIDPQVTAIWAQFPGVDPNATKVEISVRQSVFYPSRPGINFITVRGFEMSQAATPWAGAMSEQIGLVGTHWSKGWIIENNHIHHSMCTGVTLGRYPLPEGQMTPATAPGFVKSIEYAFRDGWSREKIGGHIVRNNHIHHCEKNAIHGSLGACFSEISGNEIHDIALTGWVFGVDTAGIKFLGGVDIRITGNHIYNCGGSAGVWLDWMAQGAQVTGNLLHDNNARSGDIYCEMQHGPLLLANNILLSRLSLCINSEGLGLAHNLVNGEIKAFSDSRSTPFHPAHSLTLAGNYTACGGDHRFYNNVFFGGWTGKHLTTAKLPSTASGNVFVGKALPFKFGDTTVHAETFNAPPVLTQKADGWYLRLAADSSWRTAGRCRIVTSELLGTAKIPNVRYENPDCSPIRIDIDYFGKPRNESNPFPGPFEIIRDGEQEFKVWPKSPSLPADNR